MPFSGSQRSDVSKQQLPDLARHDIQDSNRLL